MRLMRGNFAKKDVSGLALFILAFKLLIGAVLLVLGADWLVRGASIIARKFNIPPHVVGLTLVALGTSAPELFVNVLAAFDGRTEFALANVSGSNLANLCVGFGMCAILASACIKPKEFFSDCVMLVLAPLVVYGALWLRADGALPWLTVVPLSLVLLFYLWSLKGREADDEPDPDIAKANLGLGILFFLLGTFALYFGGETMLSSAVSIAKKLSIGADVIALTIVAFGTSIPDITASVVAARRGEYGIATGNILGSNISNIAVVLNATLWVNRGPLDASSEVHTDYLVVSIVSLVVCTLACRRECVPKSFAWLLLVGYVAYLVVRVMMA